MKKVFLTLILTILPLLASAEAVEIDGIWYNLIAKAKEAEVANTSAYYSGSIVIPKSVTRDGVEYKVTSIGKSAFNGCYDLTSVTIGNNVTSIGDCAFYGCHDLTSVTIGNNVTSIGDCVFSYCEDLTSVTIPNSVTSIGEKAFEWCNNLTSVTIPNSVTSIGDDAFYYCSSLKEVNISDIAAWCNIIWGDVASNPLNYSGHLFLNGEEIKELIIPNSVTYIRDYAFSCCSGLNSVTIGNNVTSIGDFAFSYCRGLTSVAIPNSVTSIGEKAFQGCSSLTSLTIPNSVTSIGSYAFYGCSGLTSVTIPNSVTSIGEKAISGCSSLTSITIPNSVTSIGDGAFSGCSSLTSITIPNSVASIGIYVFYCCRALSSVTIGKSVTSIGDGAFSGCTALTSVHISDLAAWCGIKFSDNPLYYAHRIYLNGEEIKDLIFPNSVTNIGDGAFKGCTNLNSVTIGNSVTSIGNGAFSDCSGLTSITIGNNVTSIGESAFNGCSGLTSVHISDLARWCGINFYGNPLSIAHHLYLNGKEIKDLVIPSSVSIISDHAFDGCSGLTSVTIPNSMTSINGRAFANCDNLMDVYCMAETLNNYYWDSEALYTDPNAFEGSYPQVMTLHVPAASIEAYRSTEPWSQFKTFVTIEDGDIPTPPEPPTPQKCATPEINYVDGKVSFSCETEGVEYISDVTVADAKKYYDSEFTLSQTYKITVYAIKTGYENSDVATREIIIENGQSSLFGDLNKDGKVDVADHVTLSNIIMNK